MAGLHAARKAAVSGLALLCVWEVAWWLIPPVLESVPAGERGQFVHATGAFMIVVATAAKAVVASLRTEASMPVEAGAWAWPGALDPARDGLAGGTDAVEVLGQGPGEPGQRRVVKARARDPIER